MPFVPGPPFDPAVRGGRRPHRVRAGGHAGYRSLLPLVLLLGAAGCSDRSQVVEPPTGRYALTGRVRLDGERTDTANQTQGPMIVRDASGVRVRLQRPDGTVDSVVTHDGAFEFRADADGFYRVSCWVVAPETVATSSVTLAASDATFPDTLVLGAEGVIATYPNPFPTADGVAIEFEALANQRVRTWFLDLPGNEVRSFSDSVVNGFNHFHWVGDDGSGGRVPNGLYWVVQRRDGGLHYDLVDKE